MFRQIREHLATVAEGLTRGGASPLPSGALLAWPVGGFVAVYALDADAQTITLTEVTKRLM